MELNNSIVTYINIAKSGLFEQTNIFRLEWRTNCGEYLSKTILVHDNICRVDISYVA